MTSGAPRGRQGTSTELGDAAGPGAPRDRHSAPPIPCVSVQQPWRAWPRERALRTSLLFLTSHLPIKPLFFFFIFLIKKRRKKKKDFFLINTNAERMQRIQALRGWTGAKEQRGLEASGSPDKLPAPQKTTLGTKTHRTSTAGPGGLGESPLPCVVTFPARKDQNRRHFSIFAGFTKMCYDVEKERETDNSGGASGCRVFVCILPSPSPSLLLSGLFVWGLLPTVTLWRVLGMVCRGNQKYTLYGFG